MPFIKTRGIDFYYEEKGEGPSILLIPPSGSTASTWGALRGDLAEYGRVIMYDRRGYSRSAGAVVRSAAVHALDAAALVEALEAAPAAAVGTSAGATIALDLAVRRPDLVRAVVVHEAAWRALHHPDASGLGALTRMQWLAWRGRYPEAAETLLRWVYSYRDGGSAWDAFAEQWRQTARENGRSVVADLQASVGGYPRENDLARITAPVVCTYGSRSRPYMRAVTRSLARAIPTATVREIDGTAHAVAFDASRIFATIIADAISSTESGKQKGGAMQSIKEAADTFLASKRVAVTGVSRTPKTHGSNNVYRRLRERGYQVFAVNPNTDRVEGDRCYPDLASIPGGVQAVMIGTRPELAENTMRECAELGIKHVWMHRGPGTGSVSDAATGYGREHGITVIDGGCPLMFAPTADAGHKIMRLVYARKIPNHV